MGHEARDRVKKTQWLVPAACRIPEFSNRTFDFLTDKNFDLNLIENVILICQCCSQIDELNYVP